MNGAQFNDVVKKKCECSDCMAPADSKPYPIVTRCPVCGDVHIDEGLWASERKHKTHQCQNDNCSTYASSGGERREEWTPALVYTVGVLP